MKVLVVGSGGREHALAWKLAQSPGLTELHCAPGNPGLARHGSCHPVLAEDADGLLDLARSLDLDLVVVGPEAPLVAGVADALRHNGVAVFGPGAAAARIEGSKSFAKDVLRSVGVPTAPNLPIAKPPCVVKADGLAAGKGVFVCRTQPELEAALRAVRVLGPSFVVEKLLEGPEVSILALCDGRNAIPLPAARDFKRAFDDDEGPNTGGMGSYSPVSEIDHEQLVEQIHAPVLAELSRRGAPFVGVLFAGLMLTDDGPRVLEFNCRLGDPEAQSILPRIDGDLLGAFAAAAAGDASSVALAADPAAAVTVVVAAGEYPAHGDSGSPIYGIADAEGEGALVFHAGTAQRDDRIVTNGGRILDVTGIGATIAEARQHAYAAADRIAFEGARFRRDIAAEAALV